MSRKWKRWAWCLTSVVILLFVCAIAGSVFVNRINADARQFAQTGRAAIELLNTYKTALKAFDLKALMASYDTSYANDSDGFWTQVLQSERDGVRTYAWLLEGRRPFQKSDQAEQLSRYLASLTSIQESHFKLARVEEISNPQQPVILSVLWVVGINTSGEPFETQAHFRMRLIQTEDGFKIRKQELRHATTVIGNRQGFVDITESAGIGFVAQRNPRWATPEWKPEKFAIIKYGQGGVSAADYDQDGWYDVFFADGVQSRLYRNRGNGTFTDATTASGLPDKLGEISVALFADFDNDGDQELFLGSSTNSNRLFRNNGNGTFTDVSRDAGLGGHLVTVANAADYNNDGKLDLYIGRYLDPRTQLPTTLFYTRNGAGNSLLRNNGNLRFTDVTAEAGVREGGLTLGVAWGDYDDDGDQDLYVANDFGRNALLQNNGNETFSDVSAATGTLDFGFGMSAAFGDIDNDGDLDIYTSNVHSGQRWYGQATTLFQYLLTSLWQGTILEDFSLYKEIYGLVGTNWKAFGDVMVKGNSLLLNDGRGRFADASEQSGTNPFGWYWGSAMFDYDNDGRQDIYAVNGWITAKSTDDL